MTLDGVPSPLGNMADCDMELESPRPPPVSSRLGLQAKGSILQRLQGGFNMADGTFYGGFNMADGTFQGEFNMADGKFHGGVQHG